MIRTPRRWAGALALAGATLAGAAETPADALADLGLALLRQGDAPNQVVSPLAVITALGLAHAGLNGPAEAEIESLFGPTGRGPQGFRVQLPALLKQLPPAPFVMANRVWIDNRAAAAVPAGFRQRLATRYGADAQRVDFRQAEAARSLVNGWTAQHTNGRITELLPAGSVSAATQLTLTTAIHFRSPWERPFDAAQTAPRAFATATGSRELPTLLDERGVAQAAADDGTRVYALPFADQAYWLLLAVPAVAGDTKSLLQSMSGAKLSAWRAALQPQKCRLALPKFELAPQAASVRPALEALGVKTAFTAAADLRPMLGARAKRTHVGDVFQAAAIRIDETGGEAAAAAAATVVAKTFVPLPVPDCAVDRPFVFVVLHGASGTPLFMGRVGDPSVQ